MLHGRVTSTKVVYLPHSNVEEPITFRYQEGLPESVLNALKEKGRNHGIYSIVPFDVKNIVVAQWVNLKCRFGCSQFNANWSCPPSTPNIGEVRELLSEYTTALLLIGNRQCKDFYKLFEPKFLLLLWAERYVIGKVFLSSCSSLINSINTCNNTMAPTRRAKQHIAFLVKGRIAKGKEVIRSISANAGGQLMALNHHRFILL